MYMCLHACMGSARAHTRVRTHACVHSSAEARRGCWDSLDLELQMVVSCQVRVLESGPNFCGREVSALKHWAFFLSRAHVVNFCKISYTYIWEQSKFCQQKHLIIHIFPIHREKQTKNKKEREAKFAYIESIKGQLTRFLCKVSFAR